MLINHQINALIGDTTHKINFHINIGILNRGHSWN